LLANAIPKKITEQIEEYSENEEHDGTKHKHDKRVKHATNNKTPERVKKIRKHRKEL